MGKIKIKMLVLGFLFVNVIIANQQIPTLERKITAERDTTALIPKQDIRLDKQLESQIRAEVEKSKMDKSEWQAVFRCYLKEIGPIEKARACRLEVVRATSD